MLIQIFICLTFTFLFFGCGDSSEKKDERSSLDVVVDNESRVEVPSLNKDEEFVFDEDESTINDDFSTDNTLTESTLKQESNSKPSSKILENYQNERLYTIQVSSWESKEQAEKHMQKFLDKGFESYIQRAFISSKNAFWYRVRVGVFKTEQEAKNFANSDLSSMLYNGNYWVDLVRSDSD